MHNYNRHISSFIRWANYQHIMKRGRPLSKNTQLLYKYVIEECIKLLELSDYDSFDESFLAFYTKYLRFKHSARPDKVSQKALTAYRFYQYMHREPQIGITFGITSEKSSLPFFRINY